MYARVEYRRALLVRGGQQTRSGQEGGEVSALFGLLHAGKRSAEKRAAKARTHRATFVRTLVLNSASSISSGRRATGIVSSETTGATAGFGSAGAPVVQANNEGIPFGLADPDAPISQDIFRAAAELTGRPAAAAARR